MPQLEVATIVMKDAINVLIAKAASGPDAGKWVIPSDFIHDGERVIDASERSIREQTGLAIIPKQVLFLSEIVETGVHRVAVFAFGECASSGSPKANEAYTEVKFVDPRKLGDYQKEGMSDLTADAFFKFSKVLQAQAQQPQRSGTI
jgi:ADP-ribose pyrophosphatase YjhB (NUDIX family)